MGPEARPGGSGGLHATAESAVGARDARPGRGVGTGRHPAGRAFAQLRSREHRRQAKTHGHSAVRRSAAGAAGAFPGRIFFWRADVGPLLVRREAEPGRSDPPHRTGDGPAAVRFRGLFQIPREARLYRVRPLTYTTRLTRGI